MSYDVIWEVDAGGVFDESKARFATAGVAAERNVRLEIGDPPMCAIGRLLGDGFEKQVHCMYEALRAAWPSVPDETSKEPVGKG
jgi:hypothetical protein